MIQSLQSLQSSFSSPKFHYLKQFPQIEGHKKKDPSYKCRHCSEGSQTTNRLESRFFCDACPKNSALCIQLCFTLHHEAIKNLVRNTDLCITYMIMIHVSSDLTVTKH